MKKVAGSKNGTGASGNGSQLENSGGARIDIEAMLRTRMKELSPSEQSLAGYMLDNIQMLPFETGGSIARAVGVSEMTVTRFVRGLDNLRNLKSRLRNAVAEKDSEIDDYMARFQVRGARQQALQESLRLELDAIVNAYALTATEIWDEAVWTPMGAEEDAYFTVDSEGYALADGGFNATLRDYARFALLHLNRGRGFHGRQIVPQTWIEETRTGGRPELFGGVYHDVLPEGAYHNQFWIENSKRRAYMARGVFGQLIYIDPQAEFAAVKLSSWPEFLSTKRSRCAVAAIHAIRAALT